MANFIKRLISYLLIFTLTVNSSFVFANDAKKIGSNGDTFILNDWEDGSLGVNKTVARPLSRYVLRKMGTPGFLLGKYMQYRRLINRIPDACTLSEKMAKASTIVSILADVYNHIQAYKDSRDLKKEFNDKKEKIDELLKDDSEFVKNFNEDKELKSIPAEQVDLQFLAIDYLIEKEEKDLKRLKNVRILRYPAVALQLIANMINATELFMEGTTFGNYIAKVNLCRNAGGAADKASEAKTTAVADTSREAETARIKDLEEKSKAASKEKLDKIDKWGGSPDSSKGILENLIPWFLEPFKWLVKFDMNTKEYKGQLNTKNGVNQKEIADSVQSQGGSIAGGVMSFMNSANYAEEMIVNVIYHFKKDSKKSGLTGAIVDDLQDRAIRYSVRALVRTNIVAIDGFLRSSVGRGIIFAYNLWLSYTQIDQHEDAIKYTEYKIEKLKEYRAKIEKITKSVFQLKKPRIDTSSHLLFTMNFFKSFLSGEIAAVANSYDSNEIENIKICISDTQCKSKFELLKDDNINKSFSFLPNDVKNSQVEILKNSYTVAQFSKISKGEASIFSFDLTKVKNEIAVNEKKLNDQFVLLDKKKIITFDQLAKFEEKISLSNIEPLKKHLRDDYATINTNGDIFNFSSGDSTEDFMQNFDETSSFSKFNKGQSKTSYKNIENTGDVFKPNPFAINGVGARAPASNEEAVAQDYEFKENIHQKDQNIFEIIKSRYMKLYDSLGVVD